jgi:DNA-directed RNA polymerase specialized sigma24 family protein
MDSGSEDTIEARIARWLETGEGRDDVFAAVSDLIESRHNKFSRIYGEWVTAEALKDAAGRVFLKIKAGRYTAGRPFRPWLKTVLKNRIIDILRKEKRRGETPTEPDAAETRRTDGDINDQTTDVVRDVSQAELVSLTVLEMERRLRPDNRVIFAVASGLAEHLDRPVLDRWCAECDCGTTLRAVVDELLELPVHGRQTRLAAALGLKPNTCIQRFRRAAAELAQSPLLRALLGLSGEESPPSE